jgi:hypothetical protein
MYEEETARPDAVPDANILEQLTTLAMTTDTLPERSRQLHSLLAKLSRRPLLRDCLLGLQALAQRSEPAGARLLAAFLDANAPGARLVPRLHSFTSCRRLHLQLARQDNFAASLKDWNSRLHKLSSICQKRAARIPGPPPSDRPGDEPPWPYFRRCLRAIVAAFYRRGELTPSENDLLAELVSLEVDAYEERISQLAVQVDPFRTSSVARVLPLLSRADTEVRDLREFIGWIKVGEIDRAFHRRQPRLYEVMEAKERSAVEAAMNEGRQLQPLKALLEGLLANAQPIPIIAGCVARLMALAHRLSQRGLREREMDLLVATRFVQHYLKEDELRLPVAAPLNETLPVVLAEPVTGSGLDGWPLHGFRLEENALILPLSVLGPGDRLWRDDLPSLPAAEAEAADEEPSTQAEIRKMVLSNIGSISILLGFLRNPKIVAIPGLVAQVVQRTRSLLVLDIIANTRALYVGFANREVAYALLTSPCNIPLKSLRKFIHVKCVSKVDLQRLANDSTSIRREVGKEIQKYLASIS